MYRDASATLDERDHAVGAILIGEALIASCERARALAATDTPEAWRAMRDAHDEFPEIWRSLDRARRVLAQRGVNVTGYDELRPHVRARLSSESDDAVRVDPAALDDARRATHELKLAVPGADWAAIDRRTRGLVAAPLLQRRRHGAVIAGLAIVFALMTVAWFSSRAPKRRLDPAQARRDMRLELAEIAAQRETKIELLEHLVRVGCDPRQDCEDAAPLRCDPAGHVLARDLTRELVMDGEGVEARAFAEGYLTACGHDEAIVRWANAPLPR